jgi:hypothetical protein
MAQSRIKVRGIKNAWTPFDPPFPEPGMPLRLFYITSFFLFFTVAAVHAGTPGRLTGNGELRYGVYEAETAGKEDFKATHFTQQYSLIYKKKDEFLNGRGGKYELALGGEFTSIDTTMTGAEDIDIDTSKIFYTGNILIAPGGLPFRLQAFAFDDHKTFLIEDTFFSDQQPQKLNETLLIPGIVSDLSNGQHRTIGATLMVGITNGSYLGSYREVLSQLPRLLMDFRQEDIEDLESRIPQKYRKRNLAFVSLNKKHNWFHYRFYDYKDYFDARNDREEKSYTLGTIDHTLARQWINLTNWVTISTDGSFSEKNEIRLGSLKEDSYDFNFFAKLRRSDWDAVTLTTYNRTRAEKRFEKEMEIPIFFAGEIDRNTGWRVQMVNNWSRRDVEEEATALREHEALDDFYLASRLETGRKSYFSMTPFLEAEVKQGNQGEGKSGRIGVEYFSNRNYQPPYDIFASYAVTAVEGTAELGEEVSYWEQEGKIRLEKKLNARLRTGIDLRAIYGSGSVNKDVSNYLSFAGLKGLQISTNNNTRTDGEIRHLIASWFVEHKSAKALENRLTTTYDRLDADGSEKQVLVEHLLRYDKRSVKVQVANRLALGDVSDSTPISSQNLNANSQIEKSDLNFEHESRLTYRPNRSLEGRGEFRYDYRESDQEKVTRYTAKEHLGYNFFTINGIIRRLAVIEEELEIERFSILDDTRTVAYLTLRGNYYPTKYLFFGSAVTYTVYSPEDVAETTYRLNTGLAFSKLQFSLNYAYGTRKNDGEATALTPDRKEHRWETRLSKVF